MTLCLHLAFLDRCVRFHLGAHLLHLDLCVLRRFLCSIALCGVFLLVDLCLGGELLLVSL